MSSAHSAPETAPEGGTGAPELPPLATAPGHLIRCAQQVNERVWQRVLGTELTSVQFGVLLALGEQPGLDQRSLGELMSLDKSTAADVLLRLSRRGLVLRRPHPEDARRKLVQLSPAGMAALADATPGAAEVQRAILEPLLPRDRSALVGILRLIGYRGQPPPLPPRGNGVLPLDGRAADVPRVLLQTAPGHLIRRAQQVHTQLWGEHVGGRLTSVQFVVLLGLHAAPDVDQRTLGQQVSLDKSTSGDIIGRMVSRGLVGSSRNLSDGRRKILALTPEGRRELYRYAPAVLHVQRELLSPLSPGQQQSFTALLQQIHAPGGV